MCPLIITFEVIVKITLPGISCWMEGPTVLLLATQQCLCLASLDFIFYLHQKGISMLVKD